MRSTLVRNARLACNDASRDLPWLHTWHWDSPVRRSTPRSTPTASHGPIAVTLRKPARLTRPLTTFARNAAHVEDLGVHRRIRSKVVTAVFKTTTH